MTVKRDLQCGINIADEIIRNAMELPVESQDLLLILAKGMAFTRDCVKRQARAERICKGTGQKRE